MTRVSVVILMLLLIGVWVRPLITDAEPIANLPAGSSTQPVTRSASGSPSTMSAQADAHRTNPLFLSVLPGEDRSAFKVIRGTEGFWRIAQDANGVWWLLSPDGQREFLNTVTTVQPFQRARSPFGPHFISKDWNGGITREGDIQRWAENTLSRVRSAGFKGLGAWSHPVFHELDVPITRDLNVWTWVPAQHRRLYSPEWIGIAEEAIRKQVEPLKDNRNLVGYFTDNELDWGDGFAGPSAYFDYLPTTDPNRMQVVQVLQRIWTTLEDFNQAWDTKLQDWNDIDAWQTLPHHRVAAYNTLYHVWLEHLANDYFRITTQLVRKYDPNHLILGVRFRGHAPKPVVRGSRLYTDAQSLNYYVSDARLDFDMFRMMYEESGQPIMITEYAFHSLDGRSGNRNTVGFAAQVLDQQARADGYRLFTTRLARVPYLIGADWFQWMDEPPSGRSSDGEDVNFGIVDIDDRPYEALVQAIRETTPRLNAMHEASYKDDQTDVWRESFANKPVVNTPYLKTKLAINGELSDWPAQAKLPDIKHGHTIGLERSALPKPNVYAAWNEQGIYLGFEVFDKDIHGAPADGWWWTRDNVEFWINTRRPEADQDRYDVHSHQFFFVPREFAEDGVNGVIGQWHRDGDALAKHLIPHPDVQMATRVLADRYVVEIFVPAKALNGFDPIQHNELAFNIHVRNFQHATDYFWSAPKEIQTQLRPSTWGTLVLTLPAR